MNNFIVNSEGHGMIQVVRTVLKKITDSLIDNNYSITTIKEIIRKTSSPITKKEKEITVYEIYYKEV